MSNRAGFEKEKCALLSQHNPDLKRFRRRIRIVRMWKCSAYGLAAGTAAALVCTGLDYANFLDAGWPILVSVALTGAVLGVFWAAFEKISDDAVARSVDRRAKLEDRLTSAVQISANSGQMAENLHADAIRASDKVEPAHLYPIRLNRWHGIGSALATLTLMAFLLLHTTIFRSPQAKLDATELKNDASQIEHLTKPVLSPADPRTVSAEDQAMAKRLNQFAAELRKGRVSKEDALAKANQLQEQARLLEQSHADSLANSIQSAQTAAQKLSAMDKAAASPSSVADAKRAAQESQAKSLEAQAKALQQQLATASDSKSKMSSAERKALASKLASVNKQLKALRLSLNAEKFLNALANSADYQKAQEILAKLAQSSQAKQSGQQSPMTDAQMKKLADDLEKLAKQFNTDAKLKELAKKMLEAAKRARLCQNPSMCKGLGLGMGAGVGAMPGHGGLSMGAMPGAGAPSPDTWVGDHGNLIKTDKSSLLKVKFEDRQITSQIGDKGDQTYTETSGPSGLGSKSAVPYQAVLTKYSKTAESALQKGDVPPQMKSRVRDYFDSLRK